MFARLVVRAAILVGVGGCSQILGLTPPHAQGGGGGGGGGGDGGGSAGFTIQVTTPAPRVPQNGSDFLDIAVTRTDFDGTISVAVPSPPPGVTVTPTEIDGSATTGSLVLAGAAELTVGSDLDLELVAAGDGIQHTLDINAIVTLAPGIPDPGFGSSDDGIVSIEIANDGNYFADFSIAPDATITAVGADQEEITGLAVVARFTAAGALDTSFGSAGTGVLTIHQTSGTAPASFLAVARQSNGNVIGVGNTQDNFLKVFPAAWLASFTTKGVEVQAFGDDDSNDYIDTAFDYTVTEPGLGAVVALPDDELVAVTADQFPSTAADTAIIRQTAAGEADLTFGSASGGSAVPVALDLSFGFSTNDQGGGAGGLAADPTGTSTYVCGLGSAGAEVVHITNAGAFDPAFGSSGVVTLGFGSAGATALAVQPDGDVVVAGAPGFVARVSPTGALDASFGTNGIVDSLGATSFTSIAAVAVQADGRILVAGNASPAGTAAIVRLLPDGTIDVTYGKSGVATVFLGTNGVLLQLRLQTDGNAVGCGTSGDAFPSLAALFRVTF